MNEVAQILVVDDDIQMLEALTLYLGSRGWSVVPAANGQDALDKFVERPADLVIMDIMMPVMDGWELCQRLRQITDAPIIMLTARGQDYDKVRGFKLGADDYLVKPFSLRELAERVAALLRASR
jgi:two-component system OmpR family response regulator